MLTLLEDNQIDFSPGSGSSVTADDISFGPINNFFLTTGSQIFYGPKTFDTFFSCNTSGSSIKTLAIPGLLTVNKLNINDNIYASNNYIINGDDLNLTTGKLDTALHNVSGSINAAITVAGIGSGNTTIFPSAYDSIGQGAWVWGLDTKQIVAGYFKNSSGINGDEISYKMILSGGTYTLHIFTTKYKDRAITKWYIDDVEIASFDNYNLSFIYNVDEQQINIVIPSAGLKTLKMKAVGKNPSSSGYVMTASIISLWRTA